MEGQRRATSKRRLVVGVAGGTGSGKTTVSHALLHAVGPERAAELAQDAYYRDLHHLSPAERAAVNFDHPSAIDFELLADHIRQLRAGRPVECPIYDFTTHVRLQQTVTLAPKSVLIVEGILLFSDPSVRDLCDIKIFVDADADIRFIRRLQRDLKERGRTLDNIITQYLDTVRPMHLAFVEPTKRYADLIIPEGGGNQVAIEMLCTAILHATQKQAGARTQLHT